MSRIARHMVTFAAAAAVLLSLAPPAGASTPSNYQTQSSQASYTLPALPTPSGPAVSLSTEPAVAATPSVMSTSVAGNAAGDAITAQTTSPYAKWQLQSTQQVQTGTTPVYGWIPTYGWVNVPTQVPVYGWIDNWVLICTRVCDANGNHLPMGWASSHPLPPGIRYQGYPHVFLFAGNGAIPYLDQWDPNVNQYFNIYTEHVYDDCDEDAFTNPTNLSLPAAFPYPGPGNPLTTPAYKYNGQYGYGYYDECDFLDTYKDEPVWGITGYYTDYIPTWEVTGQTWGVVGSNPVYSTEYSYGYSYYPGQVSLSCASATHSYSATIASTAIAYGSTQTNMTLGVSNDQVSVDASSPQVNWVSPTALPAGCATSPPTVRPS